MKQSAPNQDDLKREADAYLGGYASGLGQRAGFLAKGHPTWLYHFFIFDIGGPHTYRVVYMDGRSHPANLSPSFYGHSIGWWEGDTLNIETTGFNEGFWIDRRGLPTT